MNIHDDFRSTPCIISKTCVVKKINYRPLLLKICIIIQKKILFPKKKKNFFVFAKKLIEIREYRKETIFLRIPHVFLVSDVFTYNKINGQNMRHKKKKFVNFSLLESNFFWKNCSYGDFILRLPWTERLFYFYLIPRSRDFYLNISCNCYTVVKWIFKSVKKLR